MKRDYSTGETQDVIFFVGKEVEHTPAFGMPTLFVVGSQPIDLIKKKLSNSNIEHIFFGANHSFNPSLGDFDSWDPWNQMILYFLDKGYFCSLDIPISHVEVFHEYGFCGYNNFIPQIRIPLPYVGLWNYNTMIKIDDKGFNSTNPGIWTHSLHSLMNRDNFTNWTQYKKDEII